MYNVTWQDIETGEIFTQDYTSERDAMRMVTTARMMVNLELVSTTVDEGKFRF